MAITKANSPITGRLKAIIKLVRPDLPDMKHEVLTATILEPMNTTTIANTNQMLLNISAGTTRMPTSMKKTAMNTSFIGSTLDLTVEATDDCETSVPMRKAPMAMDSPMKLESRAMAKHIPMATMMSTSEGNFREIASKTRGTKAEPMMMLSPKNTTMPTTIRTVEPRAGVSPTSRGAAKVNMNTWPMSSRTVKIITVSATSGSRSLRSLRTATTTAVLVPEIMAPRKMDATWSSPMARPDRYPMMTIRTICMVIAAKMKGPVLRRRLKFSSIPM